MAVCYMPIDHDATKYYVKNVLCCVQSSFRAWWQRWLRVLCTEASWFFYCTNWSKINESFDSDVGIVESVYVFFKLYYLFRCVEDSILLNDVMVIWNIQVILLVWYKEDLILLKWLHEICWWYSFVNRTDFY